MGEPGGDADDDELLVAARTHQEAFAALYLRRNRRVTAFFYRRTLDASIAAELAAETFARAWARRNRFNPEEGHAMAWLMGIAGNLYRNWLRRGVVSDRARRRWNLESPELMEEDFEEIEALIDLTSMRAALQAALVDLSPSLRDAVLLRVAMDLPYEEVAERLGCSLNAARVRVSRGLDQLLLDIESRP